MNLKTLQKKVKIDTTILGIVCILFAISIVGNVRKIIEYSKMSKTSFEVKLAPTDTINNTDNYYLFIEGELRYPVDYNSFSMLDELGQTNVKANIILNLVNGIVRNVIMEMIFILIYRMLRQVKEGLTPFSSKCVSTLRKVAFLSILLAVLPKVVDIAGSMYVFQYVSLNFSSLTFYIISMGVVFGILSEIFKFGCELQEDLDQIA